MAKWPLFWSHNKASLWISVWYCRKKNGISHPFNRETKRAGLKWFYSFRKRHPELTLRTLEGTSINRLKGFKRKNVYKFLTNNESVVAQNKLDADDIYIYNVDGSGFCTVPKKSPRVLNTVDKRRVGSGEQGMNTTFVCCTNAIGCFVPPMIIYKRGRTHSSLGQNGPPGSIIKISESGYIHTELFVEWLQHFINHVRPA